MKRFHSEGGFALLELLVAMSIVGIAVFGTVILTETAARLQTESNNRMEATNDILVSERERIMKMAPSQVIVQGSSVAAAGTTYNTYRNSSDTVLTSGATGACTSSPTVICATHQSTGTYLSGTTTDTPITVNKYTVYNYVFCAEYTASGSSTCTDNRRRIRVVVVANNEQDTGGAHGLVEDEFIYSTCKRNFEGPLFRASTTYKNGQIVSPTIPNGRRYMVTSIGTQTAAAEPVWPASGTVVSGAVTFTEQTGGCPQ